LHAGSSRQRCFTLILGVLFFFFSFLFFSPPENSPRKTTHIRTCAMIHCVYNVCTARVPGQRSAKLTTGLHFVVVVVVSSVRITSPRQWIAITYYSRTCDDRLLLLFIARVGRYCCDYTAVLYINIIVVIIKTGCKICAPSPIFASTNTVEPSRYQRPHRHNADFIFCLEHNKLLI